MKNSSMNVQPCRAMTGPYQIAETATVIGTPQNKLSHTARDGHMRRNK